MTTRAGGCRHAPGLFLAIAVLAGSGCLAPEPEVEARLPTVRVVGGEAGAPPLPGADVAAASRTPGPGGAGSPTPFAPDALPGDREVYRVTFTPGGDTAYFAAGADFFPLSREATIYQMVREEGAWTSPVPAPFSGEFPDIDPFVTPDGRYLYFSSIRPVDGTPRQVVDLWRVPRTGTGWGPPERLPASSDQDDLFPSVDREGRLYFARPLPDPERDGEWGIWVAHPRSGDPEGTGETASRDGTDRDAPVPLGRGVNAPGSWSFNPAVSADGSLLLLTRLNPADAPSTGFGELHLAMREGADWGAPRPLSAAVNTPSDEYHPSLSPDGRVLYFVRRDPRDAGAQGRLYSVPLEEVLPR